MDNQYQEIDLTEREEIRDGKEQASIERGEAKRENTFYCQAQESGFVKCKMICDLCLDIEQHLQK